MGWPSPQDYNEALQNPRINFRDADLKAGSPELNSLGLPNPRSGSFATVYRVELGIRRFAVKCFTKPVPDQEMRYRAIGAHLRAQNLPYTVGFDFLSEGVRVSPRWYPVLKMDWLDGQRLDRYIEAHLADQRRLQNLIPQWCQLVTSLERASIAHGDLQHGNILVVGDALRLIDYDGMWVPALNGLPSNELGEPNYQSPQRSQRDFGPELDNFSSWVIAISLFAVARDPSLWSRFQGGDKCLLFRKVDFENPTGSALIRALRTSRDADLREASALFEDLLYLPLYQVPRLDGSLLSARTPPSTGSALPDWLAGGGLAPLKAAPSFPQVAQPPGEIRPNPSWIVELAGMAKGTPSPAFANSVAFERILLLLTAAMTLAAAAIRMPQVSPLAVFLALVAGDLIFLRFRHSREPASQLLDATLKDLRAADRAISNLEAETSAVQVAIRKRTGRMETELFDLSRRRDRLRNAEADKLAAVDASCQASLLRVNQKRQSLLRRETAELQSLRASREPGISVLRTRLTRLNSDEGTELANALLAAQNGFVSTNLRQFTLASAPLSGIGKSFRMRLMNAGFITADDISSRVRSVQGIGVKRMRELLAWRASLEAKARARMPTALDAAVASQIRNRYAGQIHDVQRQLNEAEQRLAGEEAALRSPYASQRVILDHDDRTAKANAMKSRGQVTSEYTRPYTALSDAERQCREATAKALESDRLKEIGLRRQLFDMHFQRVRLLSQMQVHRSASFACYLQRLAKVR